MICPNTLRCWWFCFPQPFTQWFSIFKLACTHCYFGSLEDWFSVSKIPSFFSNVSSCIKKRCPFPILSVPFVCLYQYEVMACFFFFNILLPISVILPRDDQIIWDLANWSPFKLFLCPFNNSSSVFDYFHTLWHKMLYNYLFLCLPQPWNYPLLQGAL